jgi:hypothetical protein
MTNIYSYILIPQSNHCLSASIDWGSRVELATDAPG